MQAWIDDENGDWIVVFEAGPFRSQGRVCVYHESTVADALADLDGGVPDNPWQEYDLPYPVGKTDAVSLLLARAMPDVKEGR